MNRKKLLFLFLVMLLNLPFSCKKHLTCDDVIVSVVKPKTNDTIYSGTVVNFTGRCNLDSAKVYWVGPDKKVYKDSTFFISNVSSAHNGIYTCYAQYADCSVSKTYTLNVLQGFISASCIGTNTVITNKGNSTITFVSKGTTTSNNYCLNFTIANISNLSNRTLKLIFDVPPSTLNGYYTFTSSDYNVNSSSKVSLEYDYYLNNSSTSGLWYPNSYYTKTLTAQQSKGYLYLDICDLDLYNTSSDKISAAIKIPLSSL